MEDSFRLSLGDIIAQLEEDEAIDRLQKLVDYLAEAYRKKAENDLLKTAIEKGAPRNKERIIYWDGDENVTVKEVYEAFGIKGKKAAKVSRKNKKKMIGGGNGDKKEKVPSLWDYVPRCLPVELVDLERKTFVTDPSRQNLCFLNTDVLIKICEKLIPVDFVNLSLTCRYLHWRMFTSCKCYAPYSVQLGISDYKLADDEASTCSIMPKAVYFFDGNTSDDSIDQRSKRYLMKKRGYRALFVYQPACLKKPFFFEKLEVDLNLPFYEKADYDKCVPWILALRKFANHLKVIVTSDEYYQPFFSYPALNEFLKEVKATSCFRSLHTGNTYVEAEENTKIYMKCPYARQMDEVWVTFKREDVVETAFTNRIGYYEYPPDKALKLTLEEFFNGSKNLDFHAYYSLLARDDAGNSVPHPLLDELLNQFDDYEHYHFRRFNEMWYITLTTQETGRRIRVRISKFHNDILIGKEDTFDEMERRYMYRRFDEEVRMDVDPLGERWRFETAIEPESDDEEVNEDQQLGVMPDEEPEEKPLDVIPDEEPEEKIGQMCCLL